ncbi:MULTISPECIES: Crp/Fnr family transcriptional regulator [Rossellomorea]|jgi:CRP-like cAMP-binding protein|uniref:Crp/Fnr family transcriptional regulator n=1 Tax=Rossellomorea TaxID=2837508 RepID=UPI0011E8C976|nr:MULTISPECIES: Crp/Fnr family transcriptional regulator [Rossellomorea]MDT9023575.1 Crp/Fnr family transcriptional regulator [Rossellomorea sp. YC4-1]TYS90811.1 Crp/Fnr family transcriptional regulator [Rossellomorea aquimaris]
MSENLGVPSGIKQLFFEKNKVKTVKKGTFLFQEGKPAHELYLIKSGRIQISKVIPDGRELSLRICSSDDVIGELTLFTKEAYYMLSAKILENTETYVLPKEVFEEKLSGDNSLTIQWLKWIQIQNQQNQTKFRDLVLHGKKGALYSTLIRMSNSYGKPVENGILIDFPLTNQELANFCGSSREVVNRLLSELKKENVLVWEKGYITILDLNFLKDEIDCENCPVSICRID